MGWTDTPSKSLALYCSETFDSMPVKASRTASASGRSRRTPPTSDLCVMVWLTSLTTTG